MNESVELINERLNRLEVKIDLLIEFRYRVAGIASFAGVLGAVCVELVNKFWR